MKTRLKKKEKEQTKPPRNMGLCENDQTYIWLVYLKLTGRMEPSWKHTSGYYPGELPQPSKTGQHSNSGNIEHHKDIHWKGQPQDT